MLRPNARASRWLLITIDALSRPALSGRIDETRRIEGDGGKSEMDSRETRSNDSAQKRNKKGTLRLPETPTEMGNGWKKVEKKKNRKAKEWKENSIHSRASLVRL